MFKSIFFFFQKNKHSLRAFCHLKRLFCKHENSRKHIVIAFFYFRDLVDYGYFYVQHRCSLVDQNFPRKNTCCCYSKKVSKIFKLKFWIFSFFFLLWSEFSKKLLIQKSFTYILSPISLKLPPKFSAERTCGALSSGKRMELDRSPTSSDVTRGYVLWSRVKWKRCRSTTQLKAKASTLWIFLLRTEVTSSSAWNWREKQGKPQVFYSPWFHLNSNCRTVLHIMR